LSKEREGVIINMIRRSFDIIGIYNIGLRLDGFWGIDLNFSGRVLIFF
jgi:hypothetical protein